MKIRLRLTIWYFVITFLILIIFSYGIFHTMRELIFRAMDNDLSIVADTIERSYDPELNQFYELELENHHIDHFLEFYLVIYDTAANIIHKSFLAERIPLGISVSKDKIFEKDVLKAHPREKIPFITPVSGNEVTFRTMTRKIFYQERHIGWITVGMAISRIERSMEKLVHSILLGLSGAFILLVMSGYFLTRKALKPVDMITKKANQISHSNLKERIDIHNEKDELGQLSLTLNNLFERLQKSFESQQQFLSDSAHELKTPLAVLRAHWESELNNPDLPMPVKEKFVHDIETITRLNHLINNLLLLSESETSQSGFEWCPVRLDEILREVVENVSVLAESKSQKVRIVELPEIVIEGDKIRLYQLFFNLVDNAIKYSPNEASIRISQRIDESWAVVKIYDNGVGIAPEHISHIFERFYRVQKDRARKTGGSGLGLAICEWIARLHKGSIEVESVVNQGSTFIVKLPLYSASKK